MPVAEAVAADAQPAAEESAGAALGHLVGIHPVHRPDLVPTWAPGRSLAQRKLGRSTAPYEVPQ